MNVDQENQETTNPEKTKDQANNGSAPDLDVVSSLILNRRIISTVRRKWTLLFFHFLIVAFLLYQTFYIFGEGRWIMVNSLNVVLILTSFYAGYRRSEENGTVTYNPLEIPRYIATGLLGVAVIYLYIYLQSLGHISGACIIKCCWE